MFPARVLLLCLLLVPGPVAAQTGMPLVDSVLEPPSWAEIMYKQASIAQGWKFIVIHHSGGKSGNAAIFHEWHTTRGYGGLAYHFVIGNGKGSADGQLETGFRWDQGMAGTHCSVNAWYHNIFGIGICLVGDFTRDPPTARQMETLRGLVRRLMKEYGIGPEQVIGHKDVPWAALSWDNRGFILEPRPGKFEKQTCPGAAFPWTAFRKSLQD